MMKSILKFTFLILLCTSSFFAKAQIGYDYAQYDLGFAAGINTGTSTDAQLLRTTPSVHFNFTYNQTPYINYVVEAQFGRLKGGDSLSTIAGGREFENHFSAFAFKVQLQMGEFIDYSNNGFANAFKNLYASTGIGYIKNNIVARSLDTRLQPGEMLPGDNQSDEIFIPVRLGYEFKIFNSFNEPSVKIDIGYQYNFIMGDNLDGYNTGAHNDVFSQFTIGLKFAVGGVTSYRKQIYY